MNNRHNNASNVNNKKAVLRASRALAVLLAVLATVSGCGPAAKTVSLKECKVTVPVPEERQDEIVAYVNGEPIWAAHFRLRMRKNRALVHNYFYREYGAEDHPDFWNTSYGGEVPIEILHERTLEQCVRIKVKQLLAMEKGLMDDLSYPTFLRNLKKENERRKIAVANKEPIYGPEQYSERNYFDYLMNIMDIAVERTLAEEEFRASDETLRRYYESVKDKLYKREDDIKLQLISIPYRHEGKRVERADWAAAREAIEKARTELEHEVPFEEVAERYNPDGLLKERFFSVKTSRIDSMTVNVIKEKASALSLGEVSGVIRAYGAFHIIKCVERKHYGYLPFEDAKRNVQKVYVREKYDELVDDLVKEAQVKVNKEVLSRI